MSITAIIAEFNPFHKGHEELIRRAGNPCVILLSSNFTQRGSPALYDKFIRAQTAIDNGADLVLELPFIYSCSAGCDFSRGAIEILGRLGFIDNMAFGMENPEYDIEPLLKILQKENDEYKTFLRHELKLGASFAKAHSIALEKLLPGSAEFISKPNNMLAFSYMLEINRRGYKMKPFAFNRLNNYSSKAIREKLMPTDEPETLWPLLENIFNVSNSESLRKIHGIDEGIENLFLKNYYKSKNLDDFIGRCVNARYTRSHIRRRLINILLGLDRWEMWGALRAKIPYTRVLAFNETGRKILHEHSHNSQIKIITRLKSSATADRLGKYFAKIELSASRLYQLSKRGEFFCALQP